MKIPAHSLVALASHTLVGFGLLFGTPACDSGSGEDRAPVQRVEADLPEGVAKALIDAAGLGSDLEVADFSIYSMPEFSPEAHEELPEGCPVKSAEQEPEARYALCGVCMCDGQGTIYCIDYVCFDDIRSADSELELSTPPLSPTPAAPSSIDSSGSGAVAVSGADLIVPDRSCTPGETWSDGCNDCFCDETGVEVCTVQSCDE